MGRAPVGGAPPAGPAGPPDAQVAAAPAYSPDPSADGVVEPTSYPPAWGEYGEIARACWDLAADVVHLNTGSFGAPVQAALAAQARWRSAMDRDPVPFFADLGRQVADARRALGDGLGVDPAGLALVDNATTGVATVLAGFPLVPGDEVLVTDHGYGAVRLAAERLCRQTGARLVTASVPLLATDEEVLAAVLAVTSERTRLAVLDAVTSPTARVHPIAALGVQLQEQGVAVLVDGAHAPGMLPVAADVRAVDWWTGNLHKWAGAPRTAAVLAVAPHRRATTEPLVTSWGAPLGFPVAFDEPGTRDVTAWLAAPVALATLTSLDLAVLRRWSAAFARHAASVLADALGTAAPPPSPGCAMALVALPPGQATTTPAARALAARVSDQLHARVAVNAWQGRGWLRVSGHPTVTLAEVEALAVPLRRLVHG